MKTVLIRKNLQDTHQRRLDFVQNRYTPYLLILLFSATITILRTFLIEEWRWYHHVASFVLQVLSLFGIWQLIRLLNRELERRIPFKGGPLQRMFIQILLTLLIVSPIVASVIIVLKPYFPSFVNKQFLAVIVILFCVVVILFNFSFYVAYFFTSWQLSIEEKARLEVRAADLERERFNLQYHQLKNQVNPHYLFNTLTSLDGLIQTNPDLASEFVRHMAKVYRYVLQHKENEIVSLEEELEFIGHYIELLQVRYKDGLALRYSISEEAREKGIVMVTLQMLIDNAIKHNAVQAGSPLTISIRDDGNYLQISNNKQLRGQIDSSNGEGLKQLKHLYGFLSDKQIIIDNSEDHFSIKIPLLAS